MFLVYKADTEDAIRKRIHVKLATNTRWFGTTYPETTASDIAHEIVNNIGNGKTKFLIEGQGYRFHVHALME